MKNPLTLTAPMPAAALIDISNVSKPIKYNLFEPVSDYVAYPLSVSVTKGQETTITASITSGVEVDIQVLKSKINATIGNSVTFFASQTFSGAPSAGYKGRIVLRYTQDYYTYTVTVNNTSYKCSAFTGAYDGYYALQQISLN